MIVRNGIYSVLRITCTMLLCINNDGSVHYHETPLLTFVLVKIIQDTSKIWTFSQSIGCSDFRSNTVLFYPDLLTFHRVTQTIFVTAG